MGEPVYEWLHEDVSGVLVRPVSTSEVAESNTRSDGINVAFTVAFPNTWSGDSLRGALISITDAPWSMNAEDRSSALEVIGDPAPISPCPTAWNMQVDLKRVSG